ncbi:beta-galactosidase [Sphingomonas sp. Leaf33]|uniref:beta-galactosidase GalA n=1 Tax=Sphingomonas sp. Leaf33 TaxID=1736215 RepID=UPI0006FB2EF7|nr:beta-galactosidase GalA [Sphingomonas sp. Leaf33]KQN25665.1 beta-galactosidase [Sphingomonas sp. Leaf33]
MDRRAFLGTTSVAALLPTPGIAFAASRREWDLPMPPPRDGLDRRYEPEEPGRLLLDRGWRFHLGDIAMPVITGHEPSYENAKAGAAHGAAAISFDDSDWREVDLPHDWAIEAPVDPQANVAQGYRRRGIGWYRRTIRLDPALQGKFLEIDFGAIATHATIWINGTIVDRNWSGYNGIRVDLTPFARFGDQLNTIAIRVDADQMEGWWYEGAGVYRHVWLAVREPVHIVTDGVHCDPVRAADGSWSVPVSVDFTTIGEKEELVDLSVDLLGPDGRSIGGGKAVNHCKAMPLVVSTERLTLPIADPKLWSPDSPTLYTLVVRLGQDTRRIQIGFRWFRFDSRTGFELNGRQLKIKGTCNHQDHAGVGTAIPDALWDWRVRRLKAMGSNAIRMSHNAPPTELLDACDRHGLLVMDENRQFNPSPDYMEQLTWMVRRDRNRPSVFLWSVFNEEPMQGSVQGYEMVRRMAAGVKALDTSRPVTAAMNNGMFEPSNVSKAVDVVGFNYQIAQYDKYHAAFPDKPLTSSEDTSAFQIRGEWADDKAKNILSSYDDHGAPWGATHGDGWRAIATRPYLAGGFVWTGFDYHGEPTPFEWPTTSSLFGIMDLCGFPKLAFHQHRAQWVDDAPVLALQPHWTWPGKEGQPIRVVALTNADRVVLMLNGRMVGEAVVDRLKMPEFQVPYTPGRLEAVAYRGGREIARTAIETTGPAIALRLTPDRRAMVGDGEDVQPVTVDAVDAHGSHVPTANLPATFACQGGKIIGVGNGNPNDHDPEKGDARRLFNGLAQVIVHADAGRGPTVLRATAPGLKPATLTIDRIAAEPRAFVAITRPEMLLSVWRRLPFQTDRPSPTPPPAAEDRFALSVGRPGRLEGPNSAGPWNAYYLTFTPPARVRAKSGRVVFTELHGAAELWLDGRKIAEKTDPAPAPMTAVIPAGQGERTLSLIVRAEPGKPSGMAKLAVVRES